MFKLLSIVLLNIARFDRSFIVAWAWYKVSLLSPQIFLKIVESRLLWDYSRIHCSIVLRYLTLLNPRIGLCLYRLVEWGAWLKTSSNILALTHLVVIGFNNNLYFVSIATILINKFLFLCSLWFQNLALFVTWQTRRHLSFLLLVLLL